MPNTMRFAASILAVVLLSGCYQTTLSPTPTTSPLAAFEGTYRGFAPTDESAITMGEIEMTFSRTKISVRQATGHKVATQSLQPADFVPMNSDEVAAMFKPGATVVSSITGFKGKNGSPKLLFTKDPKDITRNDDDFGLIVFTGGMADMLGPTILFDPVQIAHGEFEKSVARLEMIAGKGVLALLRNKGLATK